MDLICLFILQFSRQNIIGMAELTFTIIKNAFKNHSITEKDYLGSEELYNVISRLNNSQFDEETFEQIWDQCKLNSKGEVRISDFIDVLVKGETLLMQKQQENSYEMARLENEKKGKLADFSDQHRYKEQMDALLEQKQGVSNSLAIIRKPFITPVDSAVRESNLVNQQLNPNEQQKEQIQQNNIVRQLFEYDSAETASTLAIIFYITAALTILAWLSSFFICQFMSMIAYTLILSQFTFQIISRKIIKFNLILLLGCTFFDILWLILETGNIWYLPENFQLARMLSSYLKFSIIFIILNVCLRIVLMYYYLSQFYIDQYQVYSIKVLGKDLNIQREAEPYTPNKNALSSFLEPYFNKLVVEGEQIQ